MEVGKKHTSEIVKLPNEASPKLQSSKQEEKGETKQHIVSGIRSTCQKSKYHMETTRKEIQGQSRLGTTGRWLMMYEQ